MSPTPPSLIPLLCPQCSQPLPAQPDEVAWLCEQCGQGALLDDQRGAAPLAIHFAAGLDARSPGRPFWVCQGRVVIQRQTFGGRNKTDEANAFWASERTFFVPAFACQLEEVIDWGTRLLNQPPALQPGPAVRGFSPPTVSPADVRPYAEFIVLAVEAGRADKLRKIDFQLVLETPELWVLP